MLESNAYLLRLRPGAFLTWERAVELSRLAKTERYQERFRNLTVVSVADFPDLEAVRKRYGFKDHFFILHQGLDAREVPIHIDGAPGERNAASVNWPIASCDERSPTQWYSVGEHGLSIKQGSYFLADGKDVRLVHSEAMRSSRCAPYLFRGGIWHRGFNQTSDERIILKWELNNASWEEAVADCTALGLLEERS
jgi:hypothetical protein